MITWTKTAHVEHHLITSSPLSEWPATLTDLRDALATLTPEQVAEVVGEPVATPAVEVLRLELDDARLRLDEALREQAPREPKPHWASRWEDGDIVEEDRTRLHAYSSDHCIRVSKDQQSLLLIADDALALIARHWPELLRGGK